MDYNVKDLPKSEQPREKLKENGVSNLTEVELLSLIIRTGTSGKNVKELSSEILNRYSLDSFPERSMEELKDFTGVSNVKAGQLKSLGELARRMQKKEREEISKLSHVKEQVQDMKFMKSEIVRAIFLSSGNKVLREEEFEGDVSSVSFSSRKIFRQALNERAAAVILSHNHPSGRSEPTEEDIEVTGQMVDLGDKLGVQILDHIVVGENFFSMRRNSSVEFQ